METIDDEIVDGAIDFMERKHGQGKPFFLWINTTHMHFRTHPKRRSLGQSGRWQSPYHDTMVDHDRHVGKVLDKLDKLGISDNTIVVYSTDNGVHMNSWPDAGIRPSAPRRTRTGKARSAFRLSFAGRGRSRQVSSRTRSSAISTGFRHCSLRGGSRKLSRSFLTGTRPGI